MSLKRNIVANYASQLYVTAIGIVMVPLYVRHMGAEAYGLVGFFSMLQAWFQLLDVGLTPTMARATATYSGGGSDALTLRRLLRALEAIFVGIAIVGAIGLIAASPFVASKWLKVRALPLEEVQQAVMLIALIVALRWVSGLYRGAISGFERQVWLSGVNIAIATTRFVFVMPVLLFVGTSPVYFFTYQLLVAVAELLLLAAYTYRLLPATREGERINWQFAPLRGVLNFSLTIAFTSGVWVLVTQTDKLVLSKLLPLSEYAYFTIAVLVAGGVTILSAPITGALLPRLTRLVVAGQEEEVLRLYREATELVTAVVLPASLVLALFAQQILWAWTGDASVAAKAAPILRLYASGNAILSLAAFPYYLQYAKGDLKLHLIGNALFVTFLIPALIWATLKHGVLGAGYAWLGANAAYFLIWVPRVHSKFAKGIHAKWLADGILKPVALPLAVGMITLETIRWPENRASLAGVLIAIGAALLVLTGMGCKAVRRRVLAKNLKPAVP
jgi:O-antigen/teichoic acid export membrane protein